MPAILPFFLSIYCSIPICEILQTILRQCGLLRFMSNKIGIRSSFSVCEHESDILYAPHIDRHNGKGFSACVALRHGGLQGRNERNLMRAVRTAIEKKKLHPMRLNGLYRTL